MKKYLIALALVLFVFPFSVNALKLNTKVTGSNETFNGSKLLYTVIVDQRLTNYKAEIIYDRDVLNLVDIKEINIDTTTKKFDIDKSESVVITSQATVNSSVIYTVEFKVKELTNADKTQVEIKTLLAKNTEQEFNIDDINLDISISPAFQSDNSQINNTGDINSYLKGILNNLKVITKEYGNPILIGSIILNIILLIALISSVIRKRVDYDF